MRSLLPWIHHPSRDPFWQQNTQSTTKGWLPASLSKQFKLKTICKHVSDYQKSSTPPEVSDLHGATSASKFYRKKLTGDPASQIKKIKVNKKENILKKADEVNNRHYAPLMKKKGNKNSQSCSLLKEISMSKFQNSECPLKKGTFSRSKETKYFPCHSRTPTDLGHQLQKLKQDRFFRSKWFADLSSVQ